MLAAATHYAQRPAVEQDTVEVRQFGVAPWYGEVTGVPGPDFLYVLDETGMIHIVESKECHVMAFENEEPEPSA